MGLIKKNATNPTHLITNFFMPMNLSEHFTLEELTASQEAVRSGIKNAPSAEQIASLRSLCVTILEPVGSGRVELVWAE